ncbi:uncharacterized protein LOC107431845 isoform X2 [Ziziphus jujuba]|uniref:Uncharacterized protein LOC107431845 isoform X2 n=1 Tax=Ziziphus jujuba TaxID=326968 RepID=A0A6P4ASA9_ZIZJJ|nr:uncharacterized protein LOC107431845 isoform X2 [Ziziphus jujuba]
MALNTLSLPALSCTSAAAAFTSSSGSRYRIQRPMLAAFPRWRNAALGQVVCMAPEEEKLTRRNPLDFPIEWERPKPGRRPDIFPQFSPMKTPLPPPLPYDPPEEDEEEEEKKEEEEEEPEKPEE